MKSMVAWVFFFALVNVFAAPMPNIHRTCGRDSKVKSVETILDSETVDDQQIHFVSEDNQIVFVRTLDGHVYRSDDEGVLWTKETVPSKMKKIDETTNLIERIFYSQAKDGVISIYMLGGGGDGQLWVSKNGGVSYEFYDTLPANVHWIVPHPMYPGTAIASRHVQGANQELYVTNDHGATWVLLPSTVSASGRFAWSPFVDTNPNRIYLLRYRNSQTANYYAGEIIYSDDWFQSFRNVPLDHVFNFMTISPNKMLVGTCSDTVTCKSKELHISEDGGKTFHVAVFPDKKKETIDERSFYVFEFADNALWTHVERYCPSSNDLCWGDLFHSNAADKDFTLSLQYHKDEDFTKYQSVDGIYVANQYVPTAGGQPESYDKVRTLITFNKGSEWNILKSPERDSNNQPLNCRLSEGCSLHLHGWHSMGEESFTYFYSIPNAVGLMIATGNVGKYLQTEPENINTYFSLNGGIDWEELRKGAWVPEIGDHGSIITLADQMEETTDIIYSINDGDEWLTCAFTDKKMDVTNIRVSQGWDSRRFVLYGTREIDGVPKAVLVHLNFDDAFSGQCKEANGDFEQWSPKNEHGHCVLGEETIYYRKKKGTNCYLGEEFGRKTDVRNCPCVEDDYECDHCFYRPDLSSPCTLECVIPNLPPDPAFCANSSAGENAVKFPVDIGYRLIDGDKCDKTLPGSTKPKALIPCKFGQSSNGPAPEGTIGALIKDNFTVLIAAIVVVIIVILIGGVWFLYKNNEAFHDMVKNTFGIGDSEADFAYSQVADPGQSLAIENTSSDEDNTVV